MGGQTCGFSTLLALVFRPHSQVMAQVVQLATPAVVSVDTELAIRPGLAREAARLFADRGVTFGVVDDEGGIFPRPIPIDPLPRRLAATEWQALERGLLQRTLALDAFI